MDFGGTVNSVGEQFRVIWNAPIPFIVVITIVGLLIWRAMEWRYGGMIARLKDECESLSKNLVKRAPAAAPAPQAPARQQQPKSQVEDDLASLPPYWRRPLVLLRNARTSAKLALKAKGDDDARRAYHEVEAAMLSVRPVYGVGPLNLKSKSGGPIPYRTALECYIAFIDEIYPLLRENHSDEAREKARAFRWALKDEN